MSTLSFWNDEKKNGIEQNQIYSSFICGCTIDFLEFAIAFTICTLYCQKPIVFCWKSEQKNYSFDAKHSSIHCIQYILFPFDIFHSACNELKNRIQLGVILRTILYRNSNIQYNAMHKPISNSFFSAGCVLLRIFYTVKLMCLPRI